MNAAGLVPLYALSQGLMKPSPATLDAASVDRAIAQAVAEQAKSSGVPDDDKHRGLRWLALLAGAGMDYGSTMHALSKPGLKEANSIMGNVAENPLAFGAVKFGSAALEGWLLDKIAKKHPKAALITSLLIGGAQGAVGANNLRLAGKAGKKDK